MSDTLVEIPAVANICDGGNLDCGSGLLLIIRKAMLETPQSGVLEIGMDKAGLGQIGGAEIGVGKVSLT